MERTCRICQQSFSGPGALCDQHRAELANQQREIGAQKNAVLEERIAAQEAERKARGRTEFLETIPDESTQLRVRVVARKPKRPKWIDRSQKHARSRKYFDLVLPPAYPTCQWINRQKSVS